MPRPKRVFMTGNSIEEVTKYAKEKYTTFNIVDVKWDKKKKVPRGALIRGKTRYYRVYLKKK